MKSEIYKCGHKATRKPWSENGVYYICEHCKKIPWYGIAMYLKSKSDILTITTRYKDRKLHNLAVKYYLKGYKEGKA